MSEQASYSLARLTLYFLRLGAIGFGGPVALVGYMYRDLVKARRWIADDDYKEGLTLAQLMPGPLAAQLAMYLGYVHYRIPGATIAGAAFVLPSFLMVVAIGWACLRYGGLPWDWSLLAQLGVFFAKAGAFVFGSGLAIVPFLYAGVDGVTAAAIGAISGAVIVLAERSIVDIVTALMALVTVALIWRIKKLPEPVVVAVAAAIGLFIYPMLHR